MRPADLRLSIMLLAGFLLAAACYAVEPLRRIDPQPALGLSAATRVAHAGLVHTTQLTPGNAEAAISSQIGSLLGKLDLLLAEFSSSRDDLVKLNVYLRNETVRGAFQQRLSAWQSLPAVSYVATPLPNSTAAVALDAVFVSHRAAPSTVTKRRVAALDGEPGQMHAAVLPAGDVVYVSGQAEPGQLNEATQKTLSSLMRTLEYLQLARDDIVQVKCFLKPMNDVATVSKQITEFFRGAPVPPVSYVEWKSGTRPIEIELVASAAASEASGGVEYSTPPWMTSSAVFSRVARIRGNESVYTSGIYAAVAESGERQVHSVFSQLESILVRAGSDLEHLAKATYYVTDTDVSNQLNRLRPLFYDPQRPPAASKAMVAGVAAAGHLITLDMIAAPVSGREVALNYHTPPEPPLELMEHQHRYDLLSPLVSDGGTRIRSADEWHTSRRPELVEHWTRILGKLAPQQQDARWFGDAAEVIELSREEREGYTRIELTIPIEIDFQQPHRLLLPRGQGPGPFPAVIAWTSTSPDYAQPEEWWGAWLARQGFVVLTGWSHIRNYRDGVNYRDNVNLAVYERFGHWLPLAKMVHDVQREVEFLQGRAEVDASRIGFMGFSLSAKAALYVAAFAPQIEATVSIDPHLALYGDTNYDDPWYLDWRQRFDHIQTSSYPVPEFRGTVLSLLDADPTRPGFERNHHELIALSAPRSLMVIGCSTDQQTARHSDDLQSSAYIARGREVYDLLGVGERLEYVRATGGHRATGPRINAAWQRFLVRWLKSPTRSAW